MRIRTPLPARGRRRRSPPAAACRSPRPRPRCRPRPGRLPSRPRRARRSTTSTTAPATARRPTSMRFPTRCRASEPLHRFANRPYTVFGREYVPATSLRPYRERGIASWYGRKFHGQKTSSGETYDMYAMTAAHPTLPLPSYARVTNTATGQERRRPRQRPRAVPARPRHRPVVRRRAPDRHRAEGQRRGRGRGDPARRRYGGRGGAAAAGRRRAAGAAARGRHGRRGWRAGAGGRGRGRLRRAAGRVREQRQRAEFRRAPREPTGADRGRTENPAGQRAVPRVRRARTPARDDARRSGDRLREALGLASTIAVH